MSGKECFFSEQCSIVALCLFCSLCSIFSDYKDQLIQEQHQASLLREEVVQLKEQIEQMELSSKARMDEIERSVYSIQTHLPCVRAVFTPTL